MRPCFWVAMVLLRCDFEDAQLPTRFAVSRVVLLPWATLSNVIFLSIENRSPDAALERGQISPDVAFGNPRPWPISRRTFAVDRAALSSRSSNRMPHGKCLHCLSMLHEVPMPYAIIQDGT